MRVWDISLTWTPDPSSTRSLTPVLRGSANVTWIESRVDGYAVTFGSLASRNGLGTLRANATAPSIRLQHPSRVAAAGDRQPRIQPALRFLVSRGTSPFGFGRCTSALATRCITSTCPASAAVTRVLNLARRLCVTVRLS